MQDMKTIIPSFIRFALYISSFFLHPHLLVLSAITLNICSFFHLLLKLPSFLHPPFFSPLPSPTPPPPSLFGTPRFSSSSLCLPPDGWQRVAACCGQANYLHNYDLPLNHMIPYLGVGN